MPPPPSLWPHLWKQQHIPDGRRIREEHYKPVDTDTLSYCWRQSIFQGGDVIRVVVHSFLVTRRLFGSLGAKALSLVFRDVEFGKTIGQLVARNKKFEPVGDKGVLIVTAGQGRHLGGISRYKSRLVEMMLHRLFKDFQLQLAQAPAVLERNLK